MPALARDRRAGERLNAEEEREEGLPLSAQALRNTSSFTKVSRL